MSDISKIKFSGTDYVIKDSVARDDIGKKVTANGGDISNTKIVTAETITTEFPAPAAGEAPKTFVGKMKKFVEDFKNWKTGVCLLGQIVNNCVSSDTNKPLAAAQGKVLMDLYNVLNTNLRFIDWDKINVSTPDYTDASPRLKIFYVNGWDNDYAKYTPTPDIKSMWIVVHIPVRPDGGFTQQWISAGTGMVYSRVYINGQWSVFGAMLGTNTNMGTVRFSKIGVTQDSDGYHMHIYDDGNTWIAKIT